MSKIIQKKLSPENRTTTLSVVEPALGLLFLKTRSKMFGSRCITTKVVLQTSLYLPPICINTQGAKKNRVRGSSFFDTDNTNLAESNMVPRVTSFVNEKSSTLALTTKSFSKPLRRTLSTCSKPKIAISNMDHYRQCLVEEGLSERTSELIILSRRKSTNSSSWNKWASWCAKDKINPFR